jgi:hypothetical protein
MNNIAGYHEYLDMNKWYYILVPVNDEASDILSDYAFYDKELDRVKDGFLYMQFHEDKYCLMEEYLFNFIDAECDLMINMYEEEFADQEHLPSILEITERMIDSSDNEEFIELANEFKGLVQKAIDFNTCIGFFF